VPSTSPANVTVTNTGRSGTGVLTARLALANNQNASGATYYGVVHSNGTDASAGVDLGTIDVLQADDATIYSFWGVSDDGTVTDNNLYGFTQIWSGATTTGDDATMRKWRDPVTDIATVDLPEVTMAAPAAAWCAIAFIMTSVEASSPQTITGALFTNTQTFPAATVSRGAVTVTGALYTDTDTFFGATVSRGAVTITAALVTDGDTFYGSTVSRGAVGITGSLVTDADTFFGATISQDGSPQTITGALFTDGDTFPAATVSRGAVTISGGLFTDSDQFFAATVENAAAPQTINGELFANDNTFFGATVTQDVARGSAGADWGGRQPSRSRAYRVYYTEPPPTLQKAPKKVKRRKVTAEAIEEAITIPWAGQWTVNQAAKALPPTVPVLFPTSDIEPKAQTFLAIAMWLRVAEIQWALQDEDDIELLLFAA
jgi:hypothetical protein